MANTSLRCGVGASQDMTGRNYNYALAEPVYAATIALASPTATETYVKPATLTGALTVTIDTTTAYLGDKINFLFTADGSGRVVTFGAGFKPSATLSISASKFGSAQFMFDGINFIETGRAITA